VKFGHTHGDKKQAKLGKRVAVVQLGDIPSIGHDSFLSFKILGYIDEVLAWTVIQLYGRHRSH
jgi:hypothetical protein